MAERIRLDIALEARGLAQSRARARDAILRGTVTVNGTVASKPHQMVSESDTLVIDDPIGKYVSRAALKLMEVADATCGGRIVSMLEGGYDRGGLGTGVAAHVTALMS